MDHSRNPLTQAAHVHGLGEEESAQMRRRVLAGAWPVADFVIRYYAGVGVPICWLAADDRPAFRLAWQATRGQDDIRLCWVFFYEEQAGRAGYARFDLYLAAARTPTFSLVWSTPEQELFLRSLRRNKGFMLIASKPTLAQLAGVGDLDQGMYIEMQDDELLRELDQFFGFLDDPTAYRKENPL